ncbi:hypothetical protein ACOMCU_15865 [Lysinibacillus sp. UGB7]|uniref:hypothetical protein n=1 Tax=Lysinibacillus sp. UGB7 TaxID=3411039 RepID=UPI003B7E667F
MGAQLYYIQYISETHVSNQHGLSELEAVCIVNDLFGRVEILKTTIPLSQDYTLIYLLENYENNWQCPDEIFYLVEKIGENVLINSLIDLAI